MTKPAPRHAHPLLCQLLAMLAVLAPGAAAATGALSADAVPATSRQVVVVTTDGWDADQGTLRRYARAADGAAWQEVGRFPVAIGRSGSAWGTGTHADAAATEGPRKREGDGRSPAGVFTLGTAFGYAQSADTRLPYAPMRQSHYCIDVPASPLYNTIVDADQVGRDAVAGSTEPMRLDLHNDDDPRYRIGFVIEHNAGNVPGDGSCIFAHLWRRAGETTAGCTAMDEADMRALLAWLDPAAQPRFVLLPDAEYRRLSAVWALPEIAG